MNETFPLFVLISELLSFLDTQPNHTTSLRYSHVVLCCVVLCCVVLCCVVLCWCCIVLCCVVLVLCCVVLCCVVSCCVIRTTIHLPLYSQVQQHWSQAQPAALSAALEQIGSLEHLVHLLKRGRYVNHTAHLNSNFDTTQVYFTSKTATVRSLPPQSRPTLTHIQRVQPRAYPSRLGRKQQQLLSVAEDFLALVSLGSPNHPFLLCTRRETVCIAPSSDGKGSWILISYLEWLLDTFATVLSSTVLSQKESLSAFLGSQPELFRFNSIHHSSFVSLNYLPQSRYEPFEFYGAILGQNLRCPEYSELMAIALAEHQRTFTQSAARSLPGPLSSKPITPTPKGPLEPVHTALAPTPAPAPAPTQYNTTQHNTTQHNM